MPRALLVLVFLACAVPVTSAQDAMTEDFFGHLLRFVESHPELEKTAELCVAGYWRDLDLYSEAVRAAVDQALTKDAQAAAGDLLETLAASGPLAAAECLEVLYRTAINVAGFSEWGNEGPNDYAAAIIIAGTPTGLFPTVSTARSAGSGGELYEVEAGPFPASELDAYLDNFTPRGLQAISDAYRKTILNENLFPLKCDTYASATCSPNQSQLWFDKVDDIASGLAYSAEPIEVGSPLPPSRLTAAFLRAVTEAEFFTERPSNFAELSSLFGSGVLGEPTLLPRRRATRPLRSSTPLPLLPK